MVKFVKCQFYIIETEVHVHNTSKDRIRKALYLEEAEIQAAVAGRTK